MRVEQHRVRIGIGLDNCSQDCCDNAGFPRSGSADDAEMLPKQLVGKDIGRDSALLVDYSDPSCWYVGSRINLREIAGRGEIHGLIEAGDPDAPRRKQTEAPSA